jgi:hypothetical protein
VIAQQNQHQIHQQNKISANSGMTNNNGSTNNNNNISNSNSSVTSHPLKAAVTRPTEPNPEEMTDLEELEQFAKTFKQRRIKLGIDFIAI